MRKKVYSLFIFFSFLISNLFCQEPSKDSLFIGVQNSLSILNSILQEPNQKGLVYVRKKGSDLNWYQIRSFNKTYEGSIVSDNYLESEISSETEVIQKEDITDWIYYKDYSVIYFLSTFYNLIIPQKKVELTQFFTTASEKPFAAHLKLYERQKREYEVNKLLNEISADYRVVSNKFPGIMRENKILENQSLPESISEKLGYLPLDLNNFQLKTSSVYELNENFIEKNINCLRFVVDNSGHIRDPKFIYGEVSSKFESNWREETLQSINKIMTFPILDDPFVYKPLYLILFY